MQCFALSTHRLFSRDPPQMCLKRADERPPFVLHCDFEILVVDDRNACHNYSPSHPSYTQARGGRLRELGKKSTIYDFLKILYLLVKSRGVWQPSKGTRGPWHPLLGRFSLRQNIRNSEYAYMLTLTIFPKDIGYCTCPFQTVLPSCPGMWLRFAVMLTLFVQT